MRTRLGRENRDGSTRLDASRHRPGGGPVRLCELAGRGRDADDSPPPPPTAQEIIAGNLEAVGGAERVRAIRTMVITGGAGSALLGTPEELTLFLARPDRFKQQGLFSTVLADGGRLLANDGVEESEITGSSAEELGYRLGFYHNAFSLLKWEEST